jgi:hypothetical protein
MNKNYLRNTAFFVLVNCVIISAQSMLGLGYPTGIPNIPSAGPSLSLGRTGVGIENDFLAMTKNPANLGIVQRAVFSSVLAYDLLSIHDNGKTSTQQLFDPQLLSFAFPLGRYGAIGLSIDQRSKTDTKFHMQKDTTLGPKTYPLESGTIRKGGIVSWQAGYGYTIKKYASLGITYERIYFTDKTTEIRNEMGKDSSEIVFRGNGIRAGLMVPYKKFTGGISGEYIFLDKATLSRSVVNNDTTTEYITQSPFEFNFKPAPSLSFGGSYQFTPQWLAAADMDITFWKEFYSQLGTAKTLDNAISVSAGGQYIIAPNLLAPKYYEIIQYRAGVRFTQMPVSTASEFAVNLGLGLPLQQGGSMFDVNFEYGKRTDSHYKKYSEDYFSIQLGINGGRKWYQTSGASY